MSGCTARRASTNARRSRRGPPTTAAARSSTHWFTDACCTPSRRRRRRSRGPASRWPICPRLAGRCCWRRSPDGAKPASGGAPRRLDGPIARRRRARTRLRRATMFDVGPMTGNTRRSPAHLRTRHPARARDEGALARDLDHPPRQSSARERRRPEGRRPPGLVGLARHHHDGALFPRAAAAGPRRGEAAREPDLPRHPVSARPPDAARSSRTSAATRARRAIPRAPRTSTTSISPPARSASASRRRCSRRWCRTMCAPTAGARSGRKAA